MDLSPVSNLVAQLRRSPGDEEGWFALARWGRRSPVGPEVAALRPVRGRLLRLLRAHPLRRELAHAMLALLDLQELGPDPAGLPRAWTHGPAGPAGPPDDPRDPATGLPLRARHRASGLEVCLVPSGRARVGKEGIQPPRHAGRHVRLHGFYLSRQPVTRAALAMWPERPASAVPADDPDAPATGLTRDEAGAFCAWAGGRLPGEYEWEYAGRSHDGRWLPWRKGTAGCPGGPEDLIRAAPHPEGGPHPGWGSAGASPFGIEDMVGRVAEWCHEVWGPPPALGVVRGGRISLADARWVRETRTWLREYRVVAPRLLSRRGMPPGFASPYLGFRLCLPLSPALPPRPAGSPAPTPEGVAHGVGDPGALVPAERPPDPQE